MKSFVSSIGSSIRNVWNKTLIAAGIRQAPKKKKLSSNKGSSSASEIAEAVADVGFDIAIHSAGKATKPIAEGFKGFGGGGGFSGGGAGASFGDTVEGVGEAAVKSTAAAGHALTRNVGAFVATDAATDFSAAAAATDATAEVAGGVGETLSEFAQAAGEIVSKVAEGAGDLAGGAVEIVGNVASGAAEVAGPVVEALGDIASGL